MAEEALTSNDLLFRHRAALERYIAERIPGLRGPMRFVQIAGGRSNPTYRIDTPTGSLVLRRRPDGPILPSAHQVDREYRIIAALAAVRFPVATPRLLSGEGDPIGVAYYVMDHLDGTVIEHPALPGLPASSRGAMYGEAVDVLARLHCLDPDAIGLAGFGRPDDYYVRQYRRWSSQWHEAALAADLPRADELVRRIGAALPVQSRRGIVHGDFRFGNLMFHARHRLIGVLDWELSTLGDPTADLAYLCLAYYLHPDAEPLGGLAGLDLAALGIPEEEGLTARYFAAVKSAPPADWPRHIAFAAFRLTIITLGVVLRRQLAARERLSDDDALLIERFAGVGLDLLLAADARQTRPNQS